MSNENSSNWLCDKCIWKLKSANKNPKLNLEPSCCLCLMRGGPLKQCNDRQKWVHLTCALCTNDVEINEPSTRSQIQVPSKLFSKERSHHSKKCTYCSHIQSAYKNTNTNLTVKCDIESCKLHFHVTCAYLNGECLLAHQDWPNTIVILCNKHVSVYKSHKTQRAQKELDEKPFEIGQEVPVTLLEENQRNHNKILMGKIVELKKQIFYEVDFGDGTFSTDMIPEDIIVMKNSRVLSLINKQLIIHF